MASNVRPDFSSSSKLIDPSSPSVFNYGSDYDNEPSKNGKDYKGVEKAYDYEESKLVNEESIKANLIDGDAIDSAEQSVAPKFVPPSESSLSIHDGDDVDADGVSHTIVRNATWQNVFFLVTTDVLGPQSAPFAVSQLGYVPGSILFTAMGFAAGYTGYQLWRLYLHLDSPSSPIRTYSDIADRIFGRKICNAINVLQSLQLLFNVAVIILGNAQGLAQITDGFCFVALAALWTAGGMLLGQIKQLKNFKHISNAAIWMNFSIIFITMALVATSEPNYYSANKQNGVPEGDGVVQTDWFVNLHFTAQVVGVMQIVYSYGGALMFIEFMAEMKRPHDFWKSMLSAQTIIGVCYLVFGLFVYRYQGQYTINPANQGISTYSWQTAANVLNLVSALIAAGLYSNVGMKVIYKSIVVDIFNGPSLRSEKGKKNWIYLSFFYWSISFFVAASVPQFSNISGLVAALCILQFSYTFPPLFMLGYQLQRDGQTDEGGEKCNWRTMSTWKRAWRGETLLKLFNLTLFIASLVTAILGVYSSISQIIDGFQQDGAATSFGCQSPV